jgi:hypothetical protein
MDADARPPDTPASECVRVLVCAIATDADAPHVAAWAASVDSVAASTVSDTFAMCIAARPSDRKVIAACALAGVHVILTHDYAEQAGSRNHAGRILGRLGLTRRALAVNARVIWFVDPDIEIIPAHWPLIRDGFADASAVSVAYPQAWAGGKAIVVEIDGVFHAYDIGAFHAVDGGTKSILAAGTGFGCIAIGMLWAATIPYTVGSLMLAPGPDPGASDAPAVKPIRLTGEDIGWLANARRAALKTRVLLGVVAERRLSPRGEPELAHTT